MNKGYEIDVAFSPAENNKEKATNGISVAGRVGKFTFIAYRDPRTGEIGEKLLGKCRNVKAHPVYADVTSTFKLFESMFKFQGDSE